MRDVAGMLPASYGIGSLTRTLSGFSLPFGCNVNPTFAATPKVPKLYVSKHVPALSWYPDR